MVGTDIADRVGGEKSGCGDTIKIGQEQGRPHVRSEVADDLDRLDQAPGIGLRNVHERLTRHYGERGKLKLDSPEGRGFIARIELLLERAGQSVVS